MRNPQGKNVHVGFNNPEPVGVCDYTGMLYMRKDLIKQMEWMGDSLQWNGFYVGKDVADVPNELNRPPPAIGDPFPVTEPRPYQTTVVIFSNQTTNWEDLTPPTWTAWGTVFNGAVPVPLEQVLQSLRSFNWSSP